LSEPARSTCINILIHIEKQEYHNETLGCPEYCIGTTGGYRILNITLKGKAIPVQAWTGPGVYGRLRLSAFKRVGT
jgi:hypothetical protein